MIRVLSLGAGVQSSVVLLMSCRGELPKLDAAIFSDTGSEPQAVYEHLPWLEEQASAAGIPVHRVSNGSLKETALNGTRFVSLPMFIKNPDGSAGMMRRQCTKEFKIVPIERFIRRELLGLKPGKPAPPRSVEHWFGISADELWRVKISTARWQVKEYPLVGLPTAYLSQPYSRRACREWFARNYPGRALPRSSCTFCPFHSDEEWRAVRANPADWAEAVAFDKSIRGIRTGSIRGEGYLHPSLLPLDEVDFRTSEELGQGTLRFGDCMGECGT